MSSASHPALLGLAFIPALWGSRRGSGGAGGACHLSEPHGEQGAQVRVPMTRPPCFNPGEHRGERRNPAGSPSLRRLPRAVLSTQALNADSDLLGSVFTQTLTERLPGTGRCFLFYVRGRSHDRNPNTARISGAPRGVGEAERDTKK